VETCLTQVARRAGICHKNTLEGGLGTCTVNLTKRWKRGAKTTSGAQQRAIEAHAVRACGERRAHGTDVKQLKNDEKGSEMDREGGEGAREGEGKREGGREAVALGPPEAGAGCREGSAGSAESGWTAESRMPSTAPAIS
jgi:hypothetical protein